MPKAAHAPTPPKPRRIVIPQSFQLFGKTIEVTTKPDLWNAHSDRIGQWEPLDQRIVIQADTPQMQRHRESKEQTFYHELAHALLEGAGRNELSKDEGLVDALGSLLHQFEKSKQGDLDV